MPGRAWWTHTTMVELGGGLTVHVLDAPPDGEPTGDPLVLLHGFGANLLAWRHVVGPLRAAGRRVVAFDRPGWGRSPLPPPSSPIRPYAFDSEAATTVALLDALGIDRAVLIGSSAGGSVAVEVAHDAPDLVAALVLVDAAVLGPHGPPSAARLVGRLPGVASAAPRFMARTAVRAVPRILRNVWHDAGAITAEAVEAATAAFGADGWAEALWAFSTSFLAPDGRAHAAAITTPTLVITGDHDRIVPTAKSLELAALIPGSELVVIPGCGHLPMEEHPQRFLAAVVPFVGRTTAAASGLGPSRKSTGSVAAVTDGSR